ncbi:slipin family protein [Streptomyces scopuliridis]|uniref:Membrane protein n=2 Tax=Streptomyces scopuliridis TaxID=452529 RepID=A0A2T7SP60_9ACTN|nr:slipin family protein [Streptomyces scopuliridis]PVE04707.1 membrane protein [Streptomyces scopuliridis RB72]WSB38813.1 slipin family protein [Streptomyces scopuliridis]WSC03252.1 slipin family protein [Streptomyces scopuliridis]WSC10869.1 slipin family protein [Streptomyces scopuliridis]
MVEELVIAVIAAVCACGLYAMAAARVIRQYERGVVFRLGQLQGAIRGPGFTTIVPFVDKLHKVNMQIVTMPVPAQDGITRDNVTVRVDAVIYFKVVDAADALVQVEDYRFAVSQMAQTSLRSIIGKSDLDDLLSNREKLNQGLELMIDSPAIGWGVQIDRVEIKDVSLPETMKRSMARQAEADRERRARVINADAELQASKKLAEAAKQMSGQPAALQLRLLQTVVAVAAEKNSTLVLPFPVELLRFLERATPAEAVQAVQAVSEAVEAAPSPPADEPAAPASAPAVTPEATAVEPGAPDLTTPDLTTRPKVSSVPTSAPPLDEKPQKRQDAQPV